MAPDAPSGKTRQEFENELMELLRKRRWEWETASEENREIAGHRFMDALAAFNGFVVFEKLPEE
jgi:hypothetical protein